MITRILTAEEVRALDASADVDEHVLIERAGAAVFEAARRMLGGTYGRTAIVLVGTGNNGNDGLVAARLLRNSGVHLTIIPVSRNQPAPAKLPKADLVIDAVLGTGFHGVYCAPDPGRARVLAVDLPSGVEADTGYVNPDSVVMRADETVSFASYKPGLLFGDGASLAGKVHVADIGLPFPASMSVKPGAYVLAEEQVRRRLQSVLHRSPDRHKWSAAVGVIGGSPDMTGAPALAASAALRSGTGMVRVGMPGGNGPLPVEVVGIQLSANHWAASALEGTAKCHAVVLGPGLGRAKPTLASARSFAMRAPQPLVIDADGFAAFDDDIDDDRTADARRAPQPTSSAGLRAIQEATARRSGARMPSPISMQVVASAASGIRNRRPGSTIITPHDGEYELLVGRRPGADRIDAARLLARESGAVTLLKGRTTVIADPTGRVEVVTAGDDRLATAGTGDVLSGIIASFLAHGLGVFDAAACGAYVHGAAAHLGHRIGLTASDLPPLVAQLLSTWSHE